MQQQFGKRSEVSTDANDSIQLGYGLGWGIYQTPYGKAIFKEGHAQEWEHYTVFYPDRDLGLIIMTNSSKGESTFRDIVKLATGDQWMPWYWENFIPYSNY